MLVFSLSDPYVSFFAEQVSFFPKNGMYSRCFDHGALTYMTLTVLLLTQEILQSDPGLYFSAGEEKRREKGGGKD